MSASRNRKPVVLSDAAAEALAGEIDALEPPAYTPEQVVEKFAERIRGRLDAGVAPEAIASVLAARGFRVTRSAILAVGKGRGAVRADGRKPEDVPGDGVADGANSGGGAEDAGVEGAA